MISLYRVIFSKLEYQIELVTQLAATFVAGVDYGIIEAKWIPTGSLGLPLLGRFSYYHIGLIVLMLVVSSALAWSHLQWLLQDKKKYIVYICAAALSLSVLVEDITWFVTRWQPIRYDEWTMIKPGLGINLGFTWIPLWYFIDLGFALLMLYQSNRYAERGYHAYVSKVTRQRKS